MVELITHYGLAFVFANVLLERVGLPLPSTPAVLVAAALAADGRFPVIAVFGYVFVGCMLGDLLWYAAGWYYGRRVISMLCHISLSPDSCVQHTEHRFERWGSITLVVAKFVPGLSTIVRPLAGTLHMDWKKFVLLSAAGSALWVGAVMWAGMTFHTQIGVLLAGIREFGPAAFGGVFALAGAYVAYKWVERRRFFRKPHVARIDVDELRRLTREAPPPVIIDPRSPLSRDEDHRSIPGALAMTLDEVPIRRDLLPANRAATVSLTLESGN